MVCWMYEKANRLYPHHCFHTCSFSLLPHRCFSKFGLAHIFFHEAKKSNPHSGVKGGVYKSRRAVEKTGALAQRSVHDDAHGRK